MIEMSETISELAAALSRAQAKLRRAERDSECPEFGSSYASLAAVWTACRTALARNGLSVTQFPGELSAGRVMMTTMLMHGSGQWVRQVMSIPITDLDPQGYGAAITYARRYALAAVVGVCPQEEENGAAARSTASRQSGTRAAARRGKIAEEQVSLLMALADEVNADIARFCQYLRIASLRDLPASQYPAAIRALEQRRCPVREAA